LRRHGLGGSGAPGPPSFRGALATKQTILALRLHGLLRFARNDGDGDAITPSRSRGMTCPEFCKKTLPRLNQRAQGRPGARRTRGLAYNVHQKMRTRAYRFGGNTPAFPAQWLYGLLRARPGDRLSCHRHLQIALRNLTPAPRRQAHTTSPYAWATLVFVTFASTASHPASVTIAKRPPSGTGPRLYMADLGARSNIISENQKLKSAARR
jgi:hypothetical protein